MEFTDVNAGILSRSFMEYAKALIENEMHVINVNVFPCDDDILERLV